MLGNLGCWEMWVLGAVGAGVLQVLGNYGSWGSSCESLPPSPLLSLVQVLLPLSLRPGAQGIPSWDNFRIKEKSSTESQNDFPTCFLSKCEPDRLPWSM